MEDDRRKVERADTFDGKDERAVPRNTPRYRHAEAGTLQRFFRRTSGEHRKDDTLEDLQEFARATEDKEAIEAMRNWTHDATNQYWDKKLDEIKSRFPFYIALFVIMSLCGLLLYMTRARS